MEALPHGNLGTVIGVKQNQHRPSSSKQTDIQSFLSTYAPRTLDNIDTTLFLKTTFAIGTKKQTLTTSFQSVIKQSIEDVFHQTNATSRTAAIQRLTKIQDVLEQILVQLDRQHIKADQTIFQSLGTINSVLYSLGETQQQQEAAGLQGNGQTSESLRVSDFLSKNPTPSKHINPNTGVSYFSTFKFNQTTPFTAEQLIHQDGFESRLKTGVKDRLRFLLTKSLKQFHELHKSSTALKSMQSHYSAVPKDIERMTKVHQRHLDRLEKTIRQLSQLMSGLNTLSDDFTNGLVESDISFINNAQTLVRAVQQFPAEAGSPATSSAILAEMGAHQRSDASEHAVDESLRRNLQISDQSTAPGQSPFELGRLEDELAAPLLSGDQPVERRVGDPSDMGNPFGPEPTGTAYVPPSSVPVHDGNPFGPEPEVEAAPGNPFGPEPTDDNHANTASVPVHDGNPFGSEPEVEADTETENAVPGNPFGPEPTDDNHAHTASVPVHDGNPFGPEPEIEAFPGNPFGPEPTDDNRSNAASAPVHDGNPFGFDSGESVVLGNPFGPEPTDDNRSNTASVPVHDGNPFGPEPEVEAAPGNPFGPEPTDDNRSNTASVPVHDGNPFGSEPEVEADTETEDAVPGNPFGPGPTGSDYEPVAESSNASNTSTRLTEQEMNITVRGGYDTSLIDRLFRQNIVNGSVNKQTSITLYKDIVTKHKTDLFLPNPGQLAEQGQAEQIKKSAGPVALDLLDEFFVRSKPKQFPYKQMKPTSSKYPAFANRIRSIEDPDQREMVLKLLSHNGYLERSVYTTLRNEAIALKPMGPEKLSWGSYQKISTAQHFLGSDKTEYVQDSATLHWLQSQ